MITRIIMFRCSAAILLISQLLSRASGIPVTSNETSPTENLHLNLNLYQGDILFRRHLFEGFRGRSATTHDWAKWPDGVVYYELDEAFSEEDKELIKSAMEEFHELTCIKWKERENEEENFVEIENMSGCWSEAGMQGGPQSVSLESPRCMKKGVVIHELMHALGFLHEISRSDRDEYVTVHYDNIIPGMEANFIKLTRTQINDLGLSYDIRSVMHYKAWAFASDRTKPTITPTDETIPLTDLGHGETVGKLTETDVQKVKKFYQCP